MSTEYDYQPQPHPYLLEPLLYISNLPVHVGDAELAHAFEHCVPFRPRIPRDAPDSYLSGTIEFKSLDKAEKALATLQSRPIPGVSPQVLMSLSPYPPTASTTLPPPSAKPRLVKQLPPGFADSQLYDLFRPFGPLASVRMQASFGKDTGVVEFWREEDAKAAEENMHCAEVGDQNIAVQVYQPRRSGSGGPAEFSPSAPPFVPSGSVGAYSPTQHSPGHYPYAQPRRASGPFVHGPGQQVQFAPPSGPGSNSHSGLIDPCNLFCKNLDPEIDSNALFAHFRPFGQIVSARVMRDDSGRSRGFGFVSYQTPDQAAQAMHSMNGIVLGSKQVVVRLHEPKQLRQEKLAQRFAGGHNGHPRSRSGATSPTASEGGESYTGWPSPQRAYSGLSSPSGYASVAAPERPRRSSGSYYHAALAGQLNMPMTYEDLSALSPVVRKEVLSGELQRRVRQLESVNAADVDAIVDSIVGLSLSDVVDTMHDPNKLQEQVQNVQDALKGPERKEQSKSPSPTASQDSALNANALTTPASAPEHPSTPVSLSTTLSTPPRTSSPSSVPTVPSGAPERERIHAKVARLESERARANEITDLLMTLSKRERAMCLFSDEVLRVKVADAKAVLESDDAIALGRTQDQPQRASSVPPTSSAPAPAATATPVTPVRKAASSSGAAPASGVEDSPRTPELSSRGPSAAASPTAPSTPSTTAVTYTLEALARLPAVRIVELANSPSGATGGLPLPKADAFVLKATDEFINSLADQTVPKQKQAVGDKLFRVIKAFGIKGAPKVTISLLDQEDLRALAHLMNSYPTVLKEKALLAQAALAAK